MQGGGAKFGGEKSSREQTAIAVQSNRISAWVQGLGFYVPAQERGWVSLPRRGGACESIHAASERGERIPAPSPRAAPSSAATRAVGAEARRLIWMEGGGRAWRGGRRRRRTVVGGWASPPWEWKWRQKPKPANDGAVPHVGAILPWRVQKSKAQQMGSISSPSPPQLPRDPGHGEPRAGLLPHLLFLVFGPAAPSRLGFQSRADLSALTLLLLDECRRATVPTSMRR